MSLLDIGYGATNGLQVMLQNMAAEEAQKARQTQLSQSQQRIDEEIRSNKAQEALQFENILSTGGLRRETADAAAAQKAFGQATQRQGEYSMGSFVPIEEYQKNIAAGLSKTPYEAPGPDIAQSKGLSMIPFTSATPSVKDVEQSQTPVQTAPGPTPLPSQMPGMTFTGTAKDKAQARKEAAAADKETRQAADAAARQASTDRRLDLIAAGTGGGSTEWVVRGGQAKEIRKGTAQPGDVPYSSGAGVGLPGSTGGAGPLTLDQVPENMRANVKSLLDYKAPLSSYQLARSPLWQEALTYAQRVDPNFDLGQFDVRKKTRMEFTSGRGGRTINSLNTAIGHLDTLSKAANDLNNAELPVWNAIKNFGLSQTGDPRIVKFNIAASAVANELSTVFKNTGATDQEIRAWRETLSASQSPEQLKGAINQAIDLLGSRLQALHNQYDQGLSSQEQYHMLSQKARDILSKLGANVDEIDPGSVYVQDAISGKKSTGSDAKPTADQLIKKYSGAGG